MKIIRPITILDANLLSSSVAENDYPAWSVATSYPLDARVIVVGTNIHRVYRALVSNIDKNPLTEPTVWAEESATNRWKMFDGVVGSQTSRADSITVSLTSAEFVNAVALINVDCASVRVKVTDAVDGVVYDQTVSMASSSGINDWWSWFFDPIVRVSDAVITDLPVYINATIEITLTNTGGTVLCGNLVLGQSKVIGGTRWRGSVGIQDYSRKVRNDFGGFDIVERDYNKRGRFDVIVQSSYVDELQRLLASYRATPVVYAATDQYASTIIFGFYRDFDVVIAYSKQSECSIEIEGLI